MVRCQDKWNHSTYVILLWHYSAPLIFSIHQLCKSFITFNGAASESIVFNIWIMLVFKKFYQNTHFLECDIRKLLLASVHNITLIFPSAHAGINIRLLRVRSTDHLFSKNFMLKLRTQSVTRVYTLSVGTTMAKIWPCIQNRSRLLRRTIFN